MHTSGAGPEHKEKLGIPDERLSLDTAWSRDNEQAGLAGVEV